MYRFDKILTAIDGLLYVYDTIQADNYDKKLSSIIMAMSSLMSLVDPIKNKASSEGFTDIEKVSEIINSFNSWMKNETTQELLKNRKKEVE